MTNEKFIEKMNYLGYKVVEEEGSYRNVYNNYDGRLLVSVRRDVLGSIDTDYHSFRNLSTDEKSQLLYLLVEYSLTPIEERERQDKFYWRLRRWNIDEEHDKYLNLVSDEGRVTLLSKSHFENYRTQFTEEEFGELCVEHGVIPDMFEKEQVE